MNLSPDTDQIALLAATTDWCGSHIPLSEARARPSGLHEQMRNMGWFDMTVPAARDGLGLPHATEALVFAELGRFLAPVSVLSTAVAARWSGARGPTALAVPTAGFWRAFDPAGAAEVLAADDGGVVMATLPAQVEESDGLDPSTRQAKLTVPRDGRALAPQAHPHLQLLAAAYAVGCADVARDMAADYAKVREQFERQIGWFQSIKHMCADMAVRSAVARSQLYYAACALDAGDAGGADVAFHIAAAKQLADQAALDNARANIQIHGGIGMTDAASPHLCLKRAHLLAFIAPAPRATLLGDTA